MFICQNFPGLVYMFCNVPRDYFQDFNKYQDMVQKVSLLQYDTFHWLYDCTSLRKLDFKMKQKLIEEFYYHSRDETPSFYLADNLIRNTALVFDNRPSTIANNSIITTEDGRRKTNLIDTGDSHSLSSSNDCSNTESKTSIPKSASTQRRTQTIPAVVLANTLSSKSKELATSDRLTPERFKVEKKSISVVIPEPTLSKIQSQKTPDVPIETGSI